MRLARLYCPSLTPGCVRLSAEESHHAIAVLRAKPGHEVALFDGVGGMAIGRIAGVDQRRLVLNVERVETQPFELPHRITLAVAPGRAHRHGFVVEKCTELGVAAIWPILAERSVSRPDAKTIEKWTRRAVEAAKQAGRAWVPTIAAPQTLSEALAHLKEFDTATLLTVGPGVLPFGEFLLKLRHGANVLVCVGPEGGWSETERDQTIAVGAVATSLGPTILRTETAAVAACAAACLLGAGSSAASQTTAQ